ncbi:bifunctional biotin--[acetyl-CoA-carboxylase] synthetase/biotin operon repressor [Desulfuromonas soudanensis]|uniref:Bifunctional ligase/repressor BirA n=1 Tax=Desulfuromonas soudanensis TaxID=1603606 RepID=A0A0M4DIR4_9BACT|nr:biotin--[acetyl-CoA-carboxylase] ligase [Desulfuromonas soudanensis]ALC17150.1 bifunctional biotin--[acetyl-CoA-carboxylase] synthetase/biotin operon repressor [Desulfuromonas soudanensis]
MTAKSPREEILRLFHKTAGTFVSGEEISLALGVSRTAVWKQIGLLRELGYVIEAVSSRGYRLVSTPDTLIPAEIKSGLDTGIIGSEILYFDELDSTNARARQIGDAGGADGTLVIADRQTAGKGRMGRQWVSPPGVNLYASVLLRPPIPPWQAPQLTFLSAVAVARAIEEISGVRPRVKWPNDVLLDGKKVAGLLNEMNAETEGIRYVILGIGVNLNMGAHQFPADLRYPATSLRLHTGGPVSRLAFVQSLLRHLDALYQKCLSEGFSPVIAAWEGFFDLVGKPVEVDFQDRVVRGVVEGLDDIGALLLRLADGTLERVLAGDVRPLSSPSGDPSSTPHSIR